METKDLGIYIHIPFCVRKCAYCDFLSYGVEAANEFGIKDIHRAYIESVIAELGSYVEKCNDRNIATIYIGGGTPSILDSSLMLKLFDYIKENYRVNDNAEITIECNLGTTNIEKFKAYKNAGINRLSLGLQSTDNAMLKILGRVHTYEEFLKQYEDARSVGFDNINVDLMSALPNQTVDMYVNDLTNVIALNPEHISSYSLIIEEGTHFYNNPEIINNLPSEDDAVRMYELTNEYLANAGYNRYEISNYAKNGYESRHNSSYWKLTDYIGVGLGASSYFEGVRYKVHRNLKSYISGDYHHEEVEEISNKDSMEEFMFLGLRMMEGVKCSDFKRRYGVDIESVYGEVIEKHINLGNLIKTQSHIKLSAEAIPISNQVFVDFML